MTLSKAHLLKKRSGKFWLLTSVMVLMVGCASTPHQSARHSSSYTSQYSKNTSDDQQHSAIFHKLTHQYNRWKGTPYRMGGLNKRGIDCSGFVYVTFRDAFGINLPRSTEDLARKGTPVKRQSLAVGDVVFFITGRSKRHVGIYIGNKQFIHASTSNGVMKSSLNNPYWIEHYWKSSRFLEN